MSGKSFLIATMMLINCILIFPAVAQVVYFNSFENEVGPEWSDSSTDITPIGNRRFLGQFGNEMVSLKLNNLPGHTEVTISFDLFIIRSWSGNEPDIWNLSVSDAPTLLHTTFNNHDPRIFNSPIPQAYPDNYPDGSYPSFTGASEITTLGYTFLCEPSPGDGFIDVPMDTVYKLSFVFPHFASELVLNFSGAELAGLANASWGLDNITVEAIPEPATFILLGLGAVMVRRKLFR